MSIFEHLWMIVEQSSFSSSQAKIAETLLKHYEQIPELSVQDIADSSYVTKGTVSKFLKSMTEEGTYMCFQKACEKEMPIHKFYAKKHEDALIRRYRRYHEKLIDPTQIQNICKQILSANKIIFFSKMEFYDITREFCRYLLQYGIIAKTTIYAYNASVIDELKTLSEKDLVIYMHPESSFYESVLNLSYEFDMIKLFESTKATSIAISCGEIRSPKLIEIPVSTAPVEYTDLDIYKCIYANVLESFKK